MATPVAATIEKDLAAAGFLSLGGFMPEDADGVPALSDGAATRALLLIGSTGPSLGPVLRLSPEYSDNCPDPLDRYTRRVLGTMASRYGFQILFPFDGPPYHPFQRWAVRCGGFSQSPLGVLAHTEFGPWSGFRAVFLSSSPSDLLTRTSRQGPCETCVDKPCLTICPVNAVSLKGDYDVAGCRTHLEQNPDADCWSGCLARRACPFGVDHKPPADTARFHMKSFIGL
ncbi:hypothetical protein [Roseibium album]|uniref:hypothetical protein n=1 Tax=Roseibium album TaxID=311410 RepID=UPI003BAFB9DE